MLSLSPLGLKQFVKIVSVVHRMSRYIRISLHQNRVLELFGVNDGKLASLQVCFGESFFVRGSDFSTPWEVVVDSKQLLVALRTQSFIAVDSAFFGPPPSPTNSLSFEFRCAYGVVCTKFIPFIDQALIAISHTLPQISDSLCSISIRPSTLSSVLSYCTEISHALSVRLPPPPSSTSEDGNSLAVTFTTIDLIGNSPSTCISLALNSLDAVKLAPEVQPEFLFPMSELKMLASLLAAEDPPVIGNFAKRNICWRAKIGLDVDFTLLLPVAAQEISDQFSAPSQSVAPVFFPTPQGDQEANGDISDEALAMAFSEEAENPATQESYGGEVIPGTPSQHAINGRDSVGDLFEALW